MVTHALNLAAALAVAALLLVPAGGDVMTPTERRRRARMLSIRDARRRMRLATLVVFGGPGGPDTVTAEQLARHRFVEVRWRGDHSRLSRRVVPISVCRVMSK